MSSEIYEVETCRALLFKSSACGTFGDVRVSVQSVRGSVALYLATDADRGWFEDQLHEISAAGGIPGAYVAKHLLLVLEFGFKYNTNLSVLFGTAYGH